MNFFFFFEKKHSQRKQKQKQLNKCFPPPNLFNTLSPMCYPICTREKDIPVQSSSSSSSFWNFFLRLIASYKCPARDPLKNRKSLFCLIAITNRADRDLLKKFSSLTLPWSRAKSGLIAIFWKFRALWLDLIAITI